MRLLFLDDGDGWAGGKEDNKKVRKDRMDKEEVELDDLDTDLLQAVRGRWASATCTCFLTSTASTN